MKAFKKQKAPAEPTHMRKSELARELGISRVTLDAYLSRLEPPPPQPNDDREYSIEEVAAYIGNIKNAAGAVKGHAFYKTEKVRLECERISQEMATKRGEFVSRGAIAAAIVPLISELDAMMEQQFVLVLPSRYKGKNTVECAEMNRTAKDLITARFRSGAKDIGAL
jgi:hypothetical protein